MGEWVDVTGGDMIGQSFPELHTANSRLVLSQPQANSSQVAVPASQLWGVFAQALRCGLPRTKQKRGESGVPLETSDSLARALELVPKAVPGPKWRIRKGEIALCFFFPSILLA